MRFELKPTPMQDGSTLYGVLLVDRKPPRFVGWIRPLAMDGWTLAGYDDDPSPYFRSQGEAVDGLIERDSLEQDAADWPVILGLGVGDSPRTCDGPPARGDKWAAFPPAVPYTRSLMASNDLREFLARDRSRHLGRTRCPGGPSRPVAGA